jgi:hypothetical protein
MNSSTLRHQLQCVDDRILTTERSLRRLEELVAKLGEGDEDRLEAERQLVHLRKIKSSFDTAREDLVEQLTSLVR